MAAAAAVYPPPPPRHPPPPTQLSYRSHAVDRSIEFLSAARTALKIAQARYHHHHHTTNNIVNGAADADAAVGRNNTNNNGGADSSTILPEWLIDVNPANLKLYQQQQQHYTSSNNAATHDDDTAPSLVRDSHSLLQLLDTQLVELHTLVRRRGHTNDPTMEIQHIIERFQEGAHEIKSVCNALRLAGSRPPPRTRTRTNVATSEHDNHNNNHQHNNTQYSSNQRRRHYEIVSCQLEEYAHARTDKLKLELSTRSQVLRDQSHRRKLLATGGGSSSSGGGGCSNASSTINQPITHLPTTTTQQCTDEREMGISLVWLYKLIGPL